MHTIKLQVDDTVYNEIIKSGINIQDELKSALYKLMQKKDSTLDSYMHSQQYADDREHFHNALNTIESGDENLVSHDDVWEQIEEHTKAN